MSTVLKSCFSVACADAREVDNDFLRFVELAICTGEDRCDEARRLASGFDIDSEKLWMLISEARLRNLFAIAPGMSSILPQLVSRRLERYLEKQRDMQSRFVTELADVVTAMEAANISVLSMKGPVLGQRLYGNLLRRHFSDLDLFVDPLQLPKTLELLGEMGYVLKNGQRHVSSHRFKTNHAVELRRGPYKIDLHWHLRNVSLYRIDMRAIWENRVTTEISGKPLHVLSDEHSLLLLLLSIIDDISRCKLRLKHILDLHLMVRSLGADWDWKNFFAARRSDNTLSACVNGLAVLEGIVGPDAIPERLCEELQGFESLIVSRDPNQCRQLLLQPKRSYVTWLWSSQVHRSASRRASADPRKFHMPPMGSVPRALWRSTLRSWQTVRFLADYRRASGVLRLLSKY